MEEREYSVPRSDGLVHSKTDVSWDIGSTQYQGEMVHSKTDA